MLAKLFVYFYLIVHGKLRLRGAGWLLRRASLWIPGLRDFPLKIPGVGTPRLNFRDDAAYGVLNVYLGEQGDLAPLIKWMEKVLRPGSVVWDVGANVGYLDLYFARTHPEIKALHAFEPNPGALQTLQSLFQNHPTFRIHPVGLGDKDDTLQLNVSPDASQVGSLVHSVEGGKHISVQIRRGDAYCEEQQLPLPDLIKIDVEGFEANVFAGLAGTIGRSRPIIFFEHLFLDGAVLRSLVPAGYTLYLLSDDGSVTTDLARRQEGHDAILVPDERRESFPK